MFRTALASLLLAAVLAPVAHAQSLDDVLAQHYKAVGGLDKIKSIQTIRLTGHMEIGPGVDAPFIMQRKRPGKSRMEFTFQGMTGIQAFDGEKGWAVMPFMGKKDPEPSSDEDNKSSKDDADFDGALVDWKAKGNTVELVGKESVEGADAYKLKVTKKSGDVEYDYLDVETGLLIKQEGKVKRRGTEVEAETTFGDYKDVDGYMTFFSMESSPKGSDHHQKLTFDKIELNVPMEDAQFSMPATAAADSTKGGAAAKTDDAKTAAKTAAKPDAKKKDK